MLIETRIMRRIQLFNHLDVTNVDPRFVSHEQKRAFVEIEAAQDLLKKCD